MNTWTQEQLRTFAPADDLHISPFREDGTTYGTPTSDLVRRLGRRPYVRPTTAPTPAGTAAAMTQKAGRIRIAGSDYEVAFSPADDSVLDAVDDAYRTKYATSSYLEHMVRAGRRSNSVRITPSA